jgi:hypothetical protein
MVFRVRISLPCMANAIGVKSHKRIFGGQQVCPGTGLMGQQLLHKLIMGRKT